jgi:hypothetical protein
MLSDKLINEVIVQWDEHDQFRDFEKRGEPVEVSLARDLLALRAKLKGLAEEWEQRNSMYLPVNECRKDCAAQVRKLLEGQ